MNDITLDYDLLERQARLLLKVINRATQRRESPPLAPGDAEQLYAVWELLIRLIEERPFPEAKDKPI